MSANPNPLIYAMFKLQIEDPEPACGVKEYQKGKSSPN
jgi:hypothetical protein